MGGENIIRATDWANRYLCQNHNSVLSSTYRQARTPNIIFLRNAVNDNIMYVVQTAMCINVHYIHKDVVSLNEIRQACDNLSANNISCCKPIVFFQTEQRFDIFTK